MPLTKEQMKTRAAALKADPNEDPAVKKMASRIETADATPAAQIVTHRAVLDQADVSIGIEELGKACSTLKQLASNMSSADSDAVKARIIALGDSKTADPAVRDYAESVARRYSELGMSDAQARADFEKEFVADPSVLDDVAKAQRVRRLKATDSRGVPDMIRTEKKVR